MDTTAILQELLGLLQNQKSVSLQALDQNRENQNAAINNAAFARGVGRSGFPTVQQTKFVGEKYLPAYNKINQQFASQELRINNSLQDSLKQISALNAAAAELGG